MTSDDWLFLITALIYFVWIVAFMESLAPPPKAHKRRKGTWTQDDTRGK